jgi:CsoR family transcriptional regulator, copper-sensing transcriptional repressor
MIPTTENAAPSTGAFDERQELKDMIGRLSRIQGQLRGICRMIQEQRPCVEVMQQVSAAESALARIGSFVFKRHVEHCVSTDAIRNDTPSGNEVGGLLGLVSRLDELSYGARPSEPLEAQPPCRGRHTEPQSSPGAGN